MLDVEFLSSFSINGQWKPFSKHPVPSFPTKFFLGYQLWHWTTTIHTVSIFDFRRGFESTFFVLGRVLGQKTSYKIGSFNFGDCEN